MTETGPDSPTPQVPPQLAASWAQAESRLFGGLITEQELYEQVVQVLAAVTDRLRAEPASTHALLTAQDTITTTALDCARSLGIGLDPARAEQIGLTALAIRRREVVVAEQAAARRARLDAARAAGAAWTVLEESGDPAGSPYAPYRRLEADARSGRALLVRADPDETFASVLHRVDPARVDLQTGRLAADPGPEAEPPLPDATAREARVDRLRDV